MSPLPPEVRALEALAAERAGGDYFHTRAVEGKVPNQWHTQCPLCGQPAVTLTLNGVGPTLSCREGCDPEDMHAALLGAMERPTTPFTVPSGGGAVTACHSSMLVGADSAPTSWIPVDLAPVLTGEVIDPEPSILARPDGVCLLYNAKLHQGSGEPESCKGWLALLAVAQLLDRRERVVYIDFEDSEASIVARLRALGCSATSILDSFTYVRPHEPLAPDARAQLDAILSLAPALVVIDGVTEALTLHGLDLGDNTDVAKWLELLPRPAARAGAAVLLIDHVVKDKESRGRYALGAQHKLAGIDVAYSLEVIEPFGRGREGLVKVTVQKDRPGFVRQHAGENNRVADMRLRSDTETGAVSVELTPPDQAPVFRPTVLMRRISEAVAAEPGISTNGIEKGVSGKTEAKRQGLRLLIAESYIDPRQEGNARRHYPLKPFVENPDLAPSPPSRPDLAPETVDPHLAPSPLPLRGSEARGEANPDTNANGSRPTHCTCSRPARSPRKGAADICRVCTQPLLAEGAAA